MALPLSVAVESPRRFPAVVGVELARRRARLLSVAGGTVLDLDRPEARAEVARAMSGTSVEPGYDSAVSVAQLLRFPDLVATLRGIDRLLRPEGRLLLVEPTARPGFLSVLLGSAFAGMPWSSGFHLNRDIPVAVRATTFSHDTIERFSMPTSVLPLRHGVEIHAARSLGRVSAVGLGGRTSEVRA